MAVRIKLNTAKYTDKNFRNKWHSGKNHSSKLVGARARRG